MMPPRLGLAGWRHPASPAGFRVDDANSEWWYIDSTRDTAYYRSATYWPRIEGEIHGRFMRRRHTSPAALRALMQRVGVTQMDLARWLGVGPRTVRRWVSERAQDATAPPPAVVLLLELIDTFPEVRRWLHERQSDTRTPPRV